VSERWVRECKRILDQIKNLEGIEGQDRLDIVRTLRFTLYALQRSVSGWMEWIDNPDVMTHFSLEELKEISKSLSKLTQSFIEYDCEITSHAQKDSTIREPKTPSESIEKAKDKTKAFYIK